jgi:multiple sugar transport system ATP-binding protein
VRGLRVDGLTKIYDSTPAVDDVSLEVSEQEFLVLLGPSGCGKSTLLRSIAGLEEIDDGTIYIGDVDVTSRRPKNRNISMVFQNYAVFPHMSVAKNIAFGLERQRRPKDEVKQRVQQAAELLHIENLLDRAPNNLSGGQRQRVAVARAIAYDADLLLMDEPLSNLDALLRMEMRAELKRLLKELKATVIYVTHDQVEALSMGDRVAVMEEGKIVQVDRPLAVYDTPASEFVAGFIGNPPMNLLRATVTGGGTKVDVEGHGELSTAPPDGSDGDDYLLGIRAENIDAEPAAGGEAIAGRVLVSEPLGSHTLITVQSGEHIVKVDTDPDVRFDRDADIWLRIRPEKIHWIAR